MPTPSGSRRPRAREAALTDASTPPSPDSPLGLASDAAIVVPHDTRWAGEFRREAASLSVLLAGLVEAIEHVGSTSVPGLDAKPLLDLGLAFRDRAALEEARVRLGGAGYDDLGDLGDAGGVILAKGPAAARTHLLHLVELADPQWPRLVAFRDALRADPARREEYAALKRRLAAEFPRDRPAYLEGKSTFIRTTLERLADGDRPG